jgi:hypothetical protein
VTIHAVYSLDDLARIWRIKRETIYSWLKQERKAGRGPSRYQAVVRLDPSTRKSFLWLREDYARKLQDRYYFRAVRDRTVRSTMERMLGNLKGGT